MTTSCCALLRLFAQGSVKPVLAQKQPLHLIAQQLLALCLQEHKVGYETWPEWLTGLPLGTNEQTAETVVWLQESAHLDVDGGMLFDGIRSRTPLRMPSSRGAVGVHR